ncbi:hypothetical protein [Spirosoma aureum]|nr:hypothetical protein [Spirosoma aureum]
MPTNRKKSIYAFGYEYQKVVIMLSNIIPTDYYQEGVASMALTTD